MAVISKTDPSPVSVKAVVEIMTTYKSLSPRPTIEEVEAATSVLDTVNTKQQMRLEEISSQVGPHDVPPELFYVLQQFRKTLVLFHSHEQTKEAVHLVEVDKMFQAFNDLIQRTSELVSGVTQMEKRVYLVDPLGEIARQIEIKQRDGEEQKIDGGGFKNLVRSSSSSFAGKIDGALKGLVASTSSPNKQTIFTSGDTEKLSLMKVAAIIENSAKSGERVLDLQGKLMEKIEWLPVSLGRLSNIYALNLSRNRITTLPSTIGSLSALTMLDVHSNQLITLPESFGELVNLTDLDLRANMLKSLPTSFGNLNNLINFDLGSNLFTHLPDVIGQLTSLKKLNMDTNELAEIPYTVGSCSSIVELRLDFNQLRALPEAIGKLECLEVLNLHYNKVKRLPTTMGNLLKLREVDVSFNELQSIPESLCLAVSLVKLNVGKNFADLGALPELIGNLEMLEELDICGDQIRVLPDSFRSLSKLRIFHADETPLEVPPREVIKLLSSTWLVPSLIKI